MDIKKLVLFSGMLFCSISPSHAEESEGCGLYPEGFEASRIRYESAEVIEPQVCVAETQTNSCQEGAWTGWTGEHQFVSCKERAATEELSLITISDFVYRGGFRLTPEKSGEGEYPTLSFSDGVMAYNPQNHSLFISGHVYEQSIAEFAIPEIVNSTEIEDFQLGDVIYQPFVKLHGSDRVDTGVSTSFRLNGLAVNEGKLLVNYMSKYEASSEEVNTTVIFEDAANLKESLVSGPYQLGNVQSAGWLTQIPESWQERLGGNFLSGNPIRTSASNTSFGPTAFSFDTSELSESPAEEAISSKLLGFSYQKSLVDSEVISEEESAKQKLENSSKLNEVWTFLTNPTYGFIVPDSSTYVTIGTISGAESGVGYGITQDTGRVCTSYCSYEADDQSVYYWLWDLAELEKVKQGEKAPDEVMPYSYGPLPLPIGNKITGATFDSETGLLITATAGGDSLVTYNQPPLFFAYQLAEYVDESTLYRSCGDIKHGEQNTRIMYQELFVSSDEVCTSEEQTALCENGSFAEWSGTFGYDNCQQLPDYSAVADLPQASVEQFEYLGGFRVKPSQFGENSYSTLNFSKGVMTYNPENHSLFMVGHPGESQIAEFPIPAIVKTNTVSEMNLVTEPLQAFTKFHNTERVDTGIAIYFRVTGLELVDNSLVVNYINWYDANGTEIDTTVVFEDASNLAETKIRGPYQLDGAAHSSGWITKVPDVWQELLGGTYLFGNSPNASILSRLSVGPSGFAVTKENLVSSEPGPLSAQALLDFPPANFLYDREQYQEGESLSYILNNTDLNNDLWTIISGAGYGFIMPGTSTYITLGRSGGHESGIGYKITQDTGTLCGGSCSYEAADNYSYYWMWDVNDLIKVRYGLMEPHEVRPHSYGTFPVPADIGNAYIYAGAFDDASGTLYLSFPRGDTENQYARPPLVLAYKVNQP